MLEWLALARPSGVDSSAKCCAVPHQLHHREHRKRTGAFDIGPWSDGQETCTSNSFLYTKLPVQRKATAACEKSTADRVRPGGFATFNSEEDMKTNRFVSDQATSGVVKFQDGAVMKWRLLIVTASLQAIGATLFASLAFAQLAPSAAEVDQNVAAALRLLYSENAEARELGAKAKGVLVFPDIKKGAFIIGAQYGYGALLKGGRTAGHYRTAAASYGFQAGVKKFGYALFFMTASALDYLDASGGWAIGTGPSLVVVDQGMARSLSTTNLRSDVYAFVFNQQGLMGGMGLEGSKVTRITLD